MDHKSQEIERRIALARDEIKKRWGTPGNENGVTLFVAHHLQELEGSYWEGILGTSTPDPGQVLDVLVLESHWDDDGDDEEGMDIFDFTLPTGQRTMSSASVFPNLEKLKKFRWRVEPPFCM